MLRRFENGPCFRERTLNAQIHAMSPHHGRANQIEFTALSEQHGGGFIVEADRLRGKFASSGIKTKKEQPRLDTERD